MDVMWDDVGVLRTKTGIERGMAGLADIRSELAETGIDGSNLAFNLTWHDWLNVQSLVEMSEVIAGASLSRENSRGAHYPGRFHGYRRPGHILFHRRSTDRRWPDR